MLNELFLKELRDLSISLRFHLAFLLIVILMASSAVTYVSNYNDASTDYYNAQRENERMLRTSVRRLSDLIEVRQRIIRRPNRLSFVVNGKEELLANTYSVTAESYRGRTFPTPEIRTRRNLILGEYSDIDFVFVIGVIMSFVALILSFDSISGEKELGTLKQVLSNSVTRFAVVMAKFLSITTCVTLALLAGLIISLVIILNAKISISTEEYYRTLLIFIISVVYISLFVALGILISTMTYNSITSLVVSILIWASVVIVIPESSGMLARSVFTIPRFSDVERQARAANEQIDKQYKTIRHTLDTENILNPLNRPWTERINKMRTGSEALFHDYELKRIQQVSRALRVTMFSPYVLYARSAEMLADAGIEREREFFEHALDYREQVRQFVRSIDSMDSKYPHLYYFSFFTSQREISPTAIPQFEEPKRPLRESLSNAAIYAFPICLITLLLVAAGLLGFNGYDAR